MSALSNGGAFETNSLQEPSVTAGRIYSDYRYFYVAISLCSIVASFLIVLNVVFCYCSRHRVYWRDRHTGNRWINSIWTTTPHNNPPLDLTELEEGVRRGADNELDDDGSSSSTRRHQQKRPDVGPRQGAQQYMELQKRESDI